MLWISTGYCSSCLHYTHYMGGGGRGGDMWIESQRATPLLQIYPIFAQPRVKHSLFSVLMNNFGIFDANFVQYIHSLPGTTSKIDIISVFGTTTKICTFCTGIGIGIYRNIVQNTKKNYIYHGTTSKIRIKVITCIGTTSKIKNIL